MKLFDSVEEFLSTIFAKKIEETPFFLRYEKEIQPPTYKELYDEIEDLINEFSIRFVCHEFMETYKEHISTFFDFMIVNFFSNMLSMELNHIRSSIDSSLKEKELSEDHMIELLRKIENNDESDIEVHNKLMCEFMVKTAFVSLIYKLNIEATFGEDEDKVKECLDWIPVLPKDNFNTDEVISKKHFALVLYGLGITVAHFKSEPLDYINEFMTMVNSNT